ncbi:MFS transporter [Streptomyces sp. NPDC127036]|uniref:MFS transporter n=1 Tax=Streptomyces sp. NPDC127036 TaxID=3347112 RepID=UPI0036669B5C
MTTAAGKTPAAPPSTPPQQFRVLLSSFAFSTLSDGLTIVLLPLMAAMTSRSPLDVSLVAMGRALPWTLLAPVVGVLVERTPVRTVLVRASLLRLLVLAALSTSLVVSGPSIPPLVAAAVALGILEAFYEVAAQSSVPAMVGADQLVSANSKLTATELTLRGFLGPSAAGFVASLSFLRVSVACAILYGITAFVMVWLPSIPAAANGPRKKIRADIVEGMRYLRRDPLLLRFVMMTACGAMAYAAWIPVFTLYALAPGPLGLTSTGFGLAMSAAAFGGLAATWITARLPASFPKTHMLTASVVLGTCALATPVLTACPLLNVVALMLYSGSTVAWNIITVSYRQRSTPPKMLGRVNASYRALAWSLIPLGPLISGAVGTVAGLRPGLLFCVGISASSLFLLPGAYKHSRSLADPMPKEEARESV